MEETWVEGGDDELRVPALELIRTPQAGQLAPASMEIHSANTFAGMKIDGSVRADAILY